MADSRHRKPEARAESVEDLVLKVQRGQVRIPPWQRGLQWKHSDVRDLFDSLYQGFPIGSLLLWKRAADADRLKLGPLTINALDVPEAWWVVDGQQRLTSLTVGLSRSVPLPSSSTEDQFVLYFDATAKRFDRPRPGEAPPSTWVPLPLLLDASRLTEWVFQWQHAQDATLRQAVFDAGKRLREYRVPLYILDTDDEEWIKKVFYRVNQAGKRLAWRDVHDSLFGHRGDEHPSTLDELADELSSLGMGHLKPSRLLTALLAHRGQDVTRNLRDHYRRNPDVLEGAVVETLPTLRRVLSFLRNDVQVPHLRLLPETWQIDVLTRFFALHPDPRPRTRSLLVRWCWRTFFGAARFNEKTLRRRSIAQMNDDEEGSLQRLLHMVGKMPVTEIEPTGAFDARTASCRLALLAVAFARPRHLESGTPLDLSTLFESHDAQAFARFIPSRKGSKLSRSIANRTLHPVAGEASLTPLLNARLFEASPADDPILESHHIDAKAASHWLSGDAEGFLEARARSIRVGVERMGERMAAWKHNDRPSIDYVLRGLEPMEHAS